MSVPSTVAVAAAAAVTTALLLHRRRHRNIAGPTPAATVPSSSTAAPSGSSGTATDADAAADARSVKDAVRNTRSRFSASRNVARVVACASDKQYLRMVGHVVQRGVTVLEIGCTNGVVTVALREAAGSDGVVVGISAPGRSQVRGIAVCVRVGALECPSRQ